MAVSAKFKQSLYALTYVVDRQQIDEDINFSTKNQWTRISFEENCQSILDQWNKLPQDKRAQHWSLLRVQKYDFQRVKLWLKQSKIPSPACIKILNIIGHSDSKPMHFQLDRFATKVFANIQSAIPSKPNNVKTLLCSLAIIKNATARYRGCLYNKKRLSRTQWKQFVDAIDITYQWATQLRQVNHSMTNKFLKILLLSPRHHMRKIRNNYKYMCPWHTTVSDELLEKCNFLYSQFE
ncbi:hypothetical protein GUITHDRAFT_148290 [Guillardia theta CCMP2712]|uniref:Uncharacterized protein n=1 Tax=Guillardia theta (strain CCMP2712) TaxID=905079 RepID=L1IAI1_GUITC|nr:hypothetical protein GUITHDRAFT_148290 [Guillardia theta CCMP2712]EKX32909.1 hypothetical protein GUITHDRAFT_148290 [Guillardia theta CCMP2712]|eukprot:XP_005819889.1 hypothetical protein GUITHDRAFT_148290 [Guillardia theta CCMP2712]